MNPFRSSFKALPIVIVLTLAVVAGCGQDKEQAVSEKKSETGPCSWVAQGDLPVVADLDERLAGYVPTELSPDLSHLDATQTQVLGKLVAASKLMNEIFRIQATPCLDELTARIADLPVDRQTSVKRYFRINVGPWDRRFHHEPFFGTWPHPEGANYYPGELTTEEKAYIADGANGMDGLFTMVRRDETGSLRAIPYSEFFAVQLEQAATLLNEAAALTENASLKAFLESRAAAFLTDDYYESDMLWIMKTDFSATRRLSNPSLQSPTPPKATAWPSSRMNCRGWNPSCPSPTSTKT